MKLSHIFNHESSPGITVSTHGFASSLSAVILSLSVSVATADAWASLTQYPDAQVPFNELSRSAAAVFVAALIAYGVLCAGAAVAARALGLKSRPLAEAIILWTTLVFLFLLPFDGIQFGVYREGSLHAYTALFLALIVASLVAVRTYPGTIRMGLLYAALPVLLLVGVVWYWVTHNRPADMRYFVLATGAAICAAGALLYAAQFGTSSARMTWVLCVLGVGILIAPMSSTLGGEPARAALSAPSTLEHRTGRVILITIDSLRRDSLGCYGSGRNDTPRIDAFAQEGLRFTRAYTAAPWTLPSLASIMTGLAPFGHGVVTMANRLPDESVTFAERMLKAGYQTAGIGYNVHLTESKGMQQGFAHYDFYPRSVPPEFRSVGTRLLGRAGLIQKPRRGASTSELTDFAADWVRQRRDTDFFLWLHYYDPHSPYAPPAEYQPQDALIDRFGAAFNDKGLARDGTFGRTVDERNWIRQLYDAEVRYTDHELGRFLDALKAEGLYDDSLIVVTIDHGEEFWDHGGFEHGHTLYNELVAAPLIVKLPHVRQGGICEAPVSLGGLMPTVLDFCGVAYDAGGLTYRSFAPVLRGEGAGFDAGPLPTSGVHRYDDLEAVIWGDYKYIRSTLSDHEQLFNLRLDPRERYSLDALEPARVEEGRRLLDGLRKTSTNLPSAPADLPEDLHRELETLGYL